MYFNDFKRNRCIYFRSRKIESGKANISVPLPWSER